MLTIPIAVGDPGYKDDASEFELADSLNYGYNTTYGGDVVEVGLYTGIQVANGLFRFLSVDVSAAVTSAALGMYTTRLSGNVNTTYSIYGDLGSSSATRQAAWSTSSRYETGFSPTTAHADFVRGDLTLNAFAEIDITDVVNEIIASGAGGWATGQNMRFALIPTFSASGDTMRIAGTYRAASQAQSAYLEIVQGGGGGGVSIPVVHHYRAMMGMV